MKPTQFLMLLVLGAQLPIGASEAQDLCQGNGVGGAYIEIGPAYIGGTFAHDMGSPNLPFGACFFAVSDGLGPTVAPSVGTVCMDVSSSAFALFLLPLDAAGNIHLEFALPADPLLAGAPTLHSHVVTIEAGAWSVSKTTQLYFQNADAWAPTQPMAIERFHHTATPLYADGRDNETRVFVAGGSPDGTPTVPGATDTTELFSPLDRSFTPGPPLSVPRTTHTATRLADGRVLIAGGMDSTGVCHATCEIFDPAAGTMIATGSMSTERASHTATLLADGRVLVSGGLRDYQNPSTEFVAALDTAQATAELYDPSTGAWMPALQSMIERRAGHSATLLPDGRVMLAGGIKGGMLGTFSNQVPAFTNTVDLFDPATEKFTPVASLDTGRAYHGASLLDTGEVLLCGGLGTVGVGAEADELASVELWDKAAWNPSAELQLGAAWPAQVALDDGTALIVGGLYIDDVTGAGLKARSVALQHDGAGPVDAAAIGLNPGLPAALEQERGAATMTRLYDGTWLLLGGYPDAWSVGGDLGFVYTPKGP